MYNLDQTAAEKDEMRAAVLNPRAYKPIYVKIKSIMDAISNARCASTGVRRFILDLKLTYEPGSKKITAVSILTVQSEETG